MRLFPPTPMYDALCDEYGTEAVLEMFFDENDEVIEGRRWELVPAGEPQAEA